jgi:putative pyruvate formate lyase activating enzyme
MGQLHRLRIWDDPAIRDALAWYLEVAENERPAKFRIAATVPTHLDPATASDAASSVLFQGTGAGQICS